MPQTNWKTKGKSCGLRTKGQPQTFAADLLHKRSSCGSYLDPDLQGIQHLERLVEKLGSRSLGLRSWSKSLI